MPVFHTGSAPVAYRTSSKLQDFLEGGLLAFFTEQENQLGGRSRAGSSSIEPERARDAVFEDVSAFCTTTSVDFRSLKCFGASSALDFFLLF